MAQAAELQQEKHGEWQAQRRHVRAGFVDTSCRATAHRLYKGRRRRSSSSWLLPRFCSMSLASTALTNLKLSLKSQPVPAHLRLLPARSLRVLKPPPRSCARQPVTNVAHTRCPQRHGPACVPRGAGRHRRRAAPARATARPHASLQKTASGLQSARTRRCRLQARSVPKRPCLFPLQPLDLPAQDACISAFQRAVAQAPPDMQMAVPRSRSTRLGDA
jgi:hypothetical protein